MIIKLVNQPTETSCTSACLAMLTGRDVYDVIKEFHERWHKHQTNPDEYLRSHGFKFVTNTNPFTSALEWEKVYLLNVASLNLPGGLHHVIADTRGGQLWILDPNNGKAGKRFYVGLSNMLGDPLAVKIGSWMVDGEVIYD